MSPQTTKVPQPADGAVGAPLTDKTTPDTPRPGDTRATAIPLSSWRPDMSVKAARGQKIFVKVPFLGVVDLPSGPHLVWYVGAIALVVLDVVDWPVALLMIVGKALSDSERSESVRTLGKVMERA